MVTIDKLKDEFLKFAPALEEDYRKLMLQTFESLVKELGPQLKDVQKHKHLSGSFAMISRVIHRDNPSELSRWLDLQELPYVIDRARLNEESKRYGHNTALTWYGKMAGKLGALDEVTVSDPGLSGIITITGQHGANKVSIDQHPIINISVYGRPFHQFPSHIYVDGKFYSEAQYKTVIQGWGVEGVKIEKKLKRPLINPNDRPREFEFEYKREHIGTPEIPENYGRIDTERESAKGMSEEEAWKKIYRDDMRMGYYKRVFDQRVIIIRSWNGELIWSEKSGEPMPKDGIIEDINIWEDKVRQRNYQHAMDRRAKGYAYGTRVPAGMGRMSK